MSEPAKGDKVLSKDEIATHNKDGDLWVIVDENVYDMSPFQDEHPGGKKSRSTPQMFPFDTLRFE